MRSYHKVGSKTGRPAYRTPSRFIAKKKMETSVIKNSALKNKGRVLNKYVKKYANSA